MRGVNKVILLGRLGADPESRTTGSGRPLVALSLATSESWKDKQTGEKRERTEWHRLQVWDKLAEIAAKWCRKGGGLYVEGRLQTRKWQGQDGQDRYTTEIIVSELQLLGDSKGGDQHPQEPPVAPAPGDSGGIDDDIPF